MTYGVRVDGQWQVEVVDGWYSTAGVSLALDPDGVPHVAYAHGNPDIEPVYITLATPTETGWSHEAIDPMHYDTRMALRFTDTGVPHVAYCSATSPFVLRHAWKLGIAWMKENASTVAGSGYDVSMALDADGHPHMCHWQSGGSGTHEVCTNWDGSTWQHQQLDSVGSCNILGSGIAVDSAGDVHVVWQKHECGTPGALKYARHRPEGWTVQTIHAGFSNYSAGCSIAVDHTGAPHVVYGTQGQLVGGPSQLRYAHLDSSGNWVHERTDADGDCGEVNAVAIDRAGYLHVAYYAGDGASQSGTVRYAHAADPVATPIGDLNCDGVVDFADINPFVSLLSSVR